MPKVFRSKSFYSVLLYLSLPFLFLRLLWKARANPAYLENWHERLVVLRKPVDKHSVWIHAVSVGESIAAVSLIRELKKARPFLPIVVTNETPTGAERIRADLAGEVTQFYVPYDAPCLIKAFLKKIQPSALLLMETELWPNMLHFCKRYGVPVVLVNARLSARSAARYKKLKHFAKDMLLNLDLILAQTDSDAQRFIALGAAPGSVQVTGNIKFDLELPADLFERAKVLRQELGGGARLIWVAASTHPGEEREILKAFHEVRRYFPQVLLVSIPRHPERFQAVADLYRRQYDVVLRSEKKTCSHDTAVFVGDSMGELLLFYAVADIAFIGGSLVKKGGQNPLEAAVLGVPLVTGPHTFNFANVTERLKEIGAEVQIKHTNELAKQIIDLLGDEKRREHMSEMGKQFVSCNRGALKKQLQLMEQFFVHDTR